MRRALPLACMTAALLAGQTATAAEQGWDSSAQLRLQWQDIALQSAGPLAAADRLAPDTAPQASGLLMLEGQWKLQRGPLTATLYAQSQKSPGLAGNSSATAQELYLSGEWRDWQLSAGRKVVSWDVGYAFRPNDTVQREQRRTLTSSYLDGRLMLQAEHFSADWAYSLIWVNPDQGPLSQGADEQALALRVYRHLGSVDAYGFARWGRVEGPSLGAAFSWVCDEAVELHASARVARHSSVWRGGDDAAVLYRTSPWQQTLQSPAAQLLAGGTWTNEQQLSLILEYWWDAQALSAAQWRQWQARETALQVLAEQRPALQPAVAGNQAWEAQAFANSSLRRHNLYARLSWNTGPWTWAADSLWTPEDGGRISTLSWQWVGDRWQLEGGWRLWSGGSGSVIGQLPQQHLAYLAATRSF